MKRKLISILIAGLFGTPALAQQAPEDFRLFGSVGLGGQWVDDDTKDGSKMREYQDLTNGVITNFDIRGRGSRYWLDLFGENLGRDDQYVSLRGGTYDVFKYRLYTDSLKHQFLFNGITPYAGAGGNLQTATFPRLDPTTWNSLDEGYKRRDDGGMFEYGGASPWYVRVEGNQVRWQGQKPGASSQGTSPGNGFVELALPIDYVTRNATIEGGYSTRTMHFNLNYLVSKFENDNETVDWTNGYFGKQLDRTYLAADNRYTRFGGNATFRALPWNSTIAARFTMDELKSSVPLGTQVLNSTAGAYADTGPNVSTFDGKVKNETFTISANSSPTKPLDLHVYYNYRKRDNDSTHVSFSSTAIAGPFANEPMSYDKDNFGFDAYYRINRANRVGVGYDYVDTKREGRPDYDRTKDKRFWGEWKNSSFDWMSARLKYQRLERDSNFLKGDSGTSSADAAYWERFVTAFDLANLDQDLWKLTLDFSPAPNLELGFEGIIKKNEYRDNTLGRLKDERREVYLSASYYVPNGPRFTVFGDNEEIKYDSQHRIVGSGGVNGAYDPFFPPTASNYNWTGKIKDRNYAIGAAVDLAISEKLSIKGSAIWYKTDGSVDLALQEGVPASVTPPVPISTWDDSKRTSFTIKAVYALNKSWTITGGYAYEKYDVSDSQYDGYRYTVPGSSGQDSYLNGTYAFTSYKYNLIYAVVNYRF